MPAYLLLKFPIANIGIGSLATWPSVSAKRIDVNLTVLTRVEILIFVPPWVLRQAVKIATGFPVLDIRVGRFVNKRINALLTGRVGEVIEPVEFQRILNAAQVLLYPGYLRIVYPAYNIGRNNRCQYAQYDDDNHDFYKRESALVMPAGLAQ